MYIAAGAIIIIMFFIVITNNNMVMLRESVLTTWHNVDMQMNKRFELVSGLIEIMEAYKEEAGSLLQSLDEACARVRETKSVEERSAVSRPFTDALEELIAFAEKCPELKDDESLSKLKSELREAEEKLETARQGYNSIVCLYNKRLQGFPVSIAAARLGFRKADLFSLTGEE